MRLRRRLPPGAISVAVLALAGVLAGCGVQTTLVPPGTVVRLAAPVKAKILTYDNASGKWVQGGNAVTLPAGDYVVPPPAAK